MQLRNWENFSSLPGHNMENFNNRFITVGNRGQLISQTNFWSTQFAREGFCYLTWNAGAARLLVPWPHTKDVPEMIAAQFAVISFGVWSEQNNQETFEILFEDGSDEPYVFFLAAGQSDRRLPANEAGTNLVLSIWTETGLVGQMPTHYRTGAIPNLQEVPRRVAKELQSRRSAKGQS